MKLDPIKLQIAMANSCVTTTALAELSQLSRVAVTRFTTGKSNPKPITIGKLAKALNVNVKELIESEAATSNQFSENPGVHG